MVWSNLSNTIIKTILRIHFICFVYLDVEGLITLAILSGNIEAAVELCLDCGRMADAIIISITGKLADNYFQSIMYLIIETSRADLF